MEFLEAFAGVVGFKWPSLAASLFLTEDEIEEVRKEWFSQLDQPVKGEVLLQQGYALLMLKKWASRKDATYGRLRQTLKTSLLFPKGMCSSDLGTNLVFTRYSMFIAPFCAVTDSQVVEQDSNVTVSESEGQILRNEQHTDEAPSSKRIGCLALKTLTCNSYCFRFCSAS